MINVLTHTAATAEVSPTEHSMKLEDGTELFYRAWIPGEPTRKALVIFHRGHEHSGRLEDVVRDLRLRDVAIFAWDARGHGRSNGPRGYAPSFGCLAEDADEFVRHISETHGQRLEDTVVLGHSVGAVTVATWVHDYAPPIRAMVLVTPAIRVKLYVPFARAWLRLIQSLVRRRTIFVSSYVKGHMLTHDAEQARRYNADPLISRAIAVNVLLGLHDTATRLMADAAAIQTPALVLAGAADSVVDLSAERKFFDRLGSDAKRMRVFDGSTTISCTREIGVRSSTKSKTSFSRRSWVKKFRGPRVPRSIHATNTSGCARRWLSSHPSASGSRPREPS